MANSFGCKKRQHGAQLNVVKGLENEFKEQQKDGGE